MHNKYKIGYVKTEIKDPRNGKVLGYMYVPQYAETQEEFMKRIECYGFDINGKAPSWFAVLYRKLKWFFRKK